MKHQNTSTERYHSGTPRYDYGYQSVHFNLKQQKDQMKPTQIMLAVRINGQRYRIYTKHKVEPAFWDRENGCCMCNELLSKRVKTRMEGLNVMMSKIRTDLDVADMRAAEHGRFLSMEDLRSVIRSINRKQDEDGNKKRAGKEKCGTSPLSILREIADKFDTRISSKGEKGTSSSRKAYLYSCRRLEDYLSETHNELTDFSQLDKSFYNSFAGWLNERSFFCAGRWKQYTAATVQNTLSSISNLHNKAYEAGWCDMPGARVSGYRYAGKVHTGKIYLSEAELGQILKAGPLSRKDAEIRDMFFLSAYTGLRISDINRLNKAVVADGTIRLFQKKTHGYVTVPILKEVTGIVEKYSGSPEGFPEICPGMANKSIKKICRMAGIDTLTPVNELRGGEVLTGNSPKYELVSFHTARRSCITNLYRRGYSPNYLMVMSGHKSISSFQRYVRANNEELAEDFMRELKIKKAV